VVLLQLQQVQGRQADLLDSFKNVDVVSLPLQPTVVVFSPPGSGL